MKKILTIIALSVFSFAATAQQVEFDANDAYQIRQIMLGMNGTDALTKKQLRQFERINEVIEQKGKIPVSQIDPDVLLAYAERLAYQYKQYQQAEADAAKFIFIMKRLYKADSTVLDKRDLYFMNKEKLKNAIK